VAFHSQSHYRIKEDHRGIRSGWGRERERDETGERTPLVNLYPLLPEYRDLGTAFSGAQLVDLRRNPTHLAGKTTKKRQNFDPSTLPAGAEHLHFTLTEKPGGPPGCQSSMPRRLGKMQTSFVLLYASPLMRQLQDNI
jgi:hypothetical protein